MLFSLGPVPIGLNSELPPRGKEGPDGTFTGDIGLVPVKLLPKVPKGAFDMGLFAGHCVIGLTPSVPDVPDAPDVPCVPIGGSFPAGLLSEVLLNRFLSYDNRGIFVKPGVSSSGIAWCRVTPMGLEWLNDIAELCMGLFLSDSLERPKYTVSLSGKSSSSAGYAKNGEEEY